MSDIATKLEYLNTTKEKIRDSINLTGANIGTSDTFRSYATKLKLGLIDIINNGTDTLYSNFPKVSGIGSNLSLTPTYEAPMKLNEIQGDTLQDGTPTPDSPVPIQNVTGLQNIEVCGKNLFDGIFQQGGLDLGGSGVETGVARIRTDFIPVEPNTTYTISNNSEGLMQVGIGFYKNDKSYDTAHKINYGSWNNFPKTFTTQNDTTYIRCAFKAGDEAIIPSGNYAIQLELGPTATTHIEHQEQNFELNLGKNLYDVSTCTNAYINSTGVVTSANTNLLTDYIKIDNTKKYTISLNTEFYFIGCAYYDKNKTYLSRDTINNSSSLTITIPNNTEYIRVWVSYATNTNISKTSVMQYEPMIEKGTQRTSYSPYFTPIELCKIGNYQDYIYKNNGNWYLHQEIGKVVLDGSESWQSEAAANGYYRYNVSSYLNVLSSNAMNNRFTERINQGHGGYEYCYVQNDVGSVHIQLLQNRISSSSVNDFKNWLSNNKVDLYYILSTPTDTKITNTELINQLDNLASAMSYDDTTNISSSSENLPMIISASALKNE